MRLRTIIFDIDGTLADVTHRRHHVAKKPKNWPAFFAEMDKDPPIKDVVELFRFLSVGADYVMPRPDGLRIVFCSGRGEEYRDVTVRWLREHVSPFGHIDLRMRPAGDSRSDVVIKKEMLDKLRAEGHDIWFVVDDRQRVVDMWRENGVTVLQCAPGDFDTAPDTYRYEPKPGEALLTLMVGPSGAGKSTYIETWLDNGIITPDAVFSSDNVRGQLRGDFRDQSANDAVFAYIHAAVKTRMSFGLKAVIDATHIHRRDRLLAAALAPAGTHVNYVVIDRPLEAKTATGGWRNFILKDGETLVQRHHKAFQSALPYILKGDDLPNVVVSDLRKVAP